MNINLISPIGYTGYGVVGRNILHELSKNHKVSLIPIGNPDGPERHRKSVQDAYELTAGPDAPCVRIWHQNDMRQFVGSPKIGFTFFELDTLNELEVYNLKLCDHVLVACQWQVDICQKYGIKANVIPLGVDTSIFKPKPRPKRDKYVFLNVGKWEARKGHLELAKAFNQAFSINDNVELWMMNTNHFYKPEQTQWWKNYYTEHCGGKVKFIPWQASDEAVYNVMSQADCGVFPAKAEAWNLELLEMMAIGKPVICTDYAGHKQFTNTNNSLLLPIDGMEPAHDKCGAHPNGFWFRGGGNWAKIDYSKLATLMRKAYDNYLTTNENGYLTAQKFTWQNTSKELIDFICNIKNT